MLSVFAAQRLSMVRRATRFVVIPGLSLAGAAGVVAGTVMLVVTATGSGSEIWGTTVLVEGVVFVAGGLMGEFVFDLTTEPVGWSGPVEGCLYSAGVLLFLGSVAAGVGCVGDVIAVATGAVGVVLLLGCAVAAVALHQAHGRPEVGGYDGGYAGRYGWLIGGLTVVLYTGLLVGTAYTFIWGFRVGGW